MVHLDSYIVEYQIKSFSPKKKNTEVRPGVYMKNFVSANSPKWAIYHIIMLYEESDIKKIAKSIINKGHVRVRPSIPTQKTSFTTTRKKYFSKHDCN